MEIKIMYLPIEHILDVTYLKKLFSYNFIYHFMMVSRALIFCQEE